MTMTPTAPSATDDVDAFVDTVFEAVLGAQAVQAAFIGDKLGWYDAMSDAEPVSSIELASRTDTDERYAREWLEHQAVCGWVSVVDASSAPSERRYVLPAPHAEVLTDRDSLAYILPMARLVAVLGRSVDDIVEAYRTGRGIGWSRHGDDAREGQSDANRPMFLHQLTQEYLPAVPEVDAALRAGGRVADIGCGTGWSSIAMAIGYPQVTVDGFDIDEPSVEIGRRNASDRGVADRVRFHAADAATVQGDPYDLVTAFECIHDMPDPVSVLATMRILAGDTGTVIVMDERVGDVFTGERDPVEQVMYGYSLMCCLPDGRNAAESVATGTVMRPATLVDYARRAGFTDAEILPIDNDFFRFYRLV